MNGLAHIAIFTQDMQESIRFYQALGAHTTHMDSIEKPTGVNQLALLEWAGFTIELIEPHDGTQVSKNNGMIAHIAVTVEDLEQAAAQVRAAGVDSFLTDTPTICPDVFGGLKNWFFTGPSGEQIELLQMGL